MTQLTRYQPSWDPSLWFSDLLRWDPFPSRNAMHVEDRDETVVITVDLPGIAERDIDLTFADGVLAIVGRRDGREVRVAHTIGDSIDPDRIEASLEHGVLTVTAWKRPEAKPRRIPIGTAKTKRGAKRRFFWRKRD